MEIVHFAYQQKPDPSNMFPMYTLSLAMVLAPFQCKQGVDTVFPWWVALFEQMKAWSQ
jgi:hypothetical protein